MELPEMKKLMPDIFEEVKKLVYSSIGRKRAGLMLGLSELGIHNGFYIGAYHILTSNYIIMNKTPLYLLKNKPPDTIHGYIFHLLLHEYIHTIGVVDERACRQLTYELSKKQFGDNHIITFLAAGGMEQLFPEIIHAPTDFRNPTEPKIELVYGFDRSSANYFS